MKKLQKIFMGAKFTIFASTSDIKKHYRKYLTLIEAVSLTGAGRSHKAGDRRLDRAETSRTKTVSQSPDPGITVKFRCSKLLVTFSPQREDSTDGRTPPRRSPACTLVP